MPISPPRSLAESALLMIQLGSVISERAERSEMAKTMKMKERQVEKSVTSHRVPTRRSEGDGHQQTERDIDQDDRDRVDRRVADTLRPVAAGGKNSPSSGSRETQGVSSVAGRPASPR